MLEERTRGDEISYYSWDIDKRYDPSLILQFELEYQRQESTWPAESYNRLWPGDIEAIDECWPFDNGEDTPMPTDTMLTRENALIWPLYAMPYSAYLVEQFCAFLS